MILVAGRSRRLLVVGCSCSAGPSKMDRAGKRCPKGESGPNVGIGAGVPEIFRGCAGSSGAKEGYV